MNSFFMRSCLAICVTLVSIGAWSQQQFEVRPSTAQLRDAVVHGDSSTIYAAAYDRNQVWRIDARTGDVINSISVGRGPASIALAAQGRYLGVVNRLDGSTSIIDTQTDEVIATLPSGEGASAIVALPSGGFAVAASFADQVTLINPRQTDRTFAIENVSSVPHALAASASYLAVVTRAPAAVLLYEPGVTSPTRSVALPSEANDIAHDGQGNFVVASDDGLRRLDPNTGTLSAPTDLVAKSIEGAGDIVALTDDAVFVMSSDLSQTLARIPLTAPGVSMAVGPGVLAVVSPRDRTWHLAVADKIKSAPEPVTVAEAEPEPVPEPTPPPVQVEKEPEPEPMAAPVEREASEAATDEPEEVAAPAPESEPEPEPMPAPAVEPEPEPDPAPELEEVEEEAAPKASPATASAGQFQSKPAEEQEEAAPVAVAQATPEDSAKRQPTIRSTPLSLDRPRAPRGRRPSPLPLQDEEAAGLSAGLLGMRPFGATDDGFVMPDFTQPGEYEADVSEFGRDGTLQADGNVVFTIDETLFTMDHFTYSKDSGELHGWGNVRIEQGPSLLTANDIYFISVPEGETDAEGTEPKASAPFAGGEDGGKRRELGAIRATMIQLTEPSREFTADALDYDFRTQTGSAVNAEGQIGLFYFGAEEIVVAGSEMLDATNVWITTCDCDHEYYRLRFKRAQIGEESVFIGKTAQLELFGQPTPLIFPSWKLHRRSGSNTPRFQLDFDSGRAAEIGYFLNVGQSLAVTQHSDLGFRIFPTEKKGVGFGIDANYDFMSAPTSWLYRAEGSIRSMYTTKDSGHLEWYHRHEIRPDTTILAQWEQWFEPTFVKEFYYEEYRNRSEPRAFANITHTKPRWIATGTASAVTHGDAVGTEKLPEVTFHMLERPLLDRLYVTYDGSAGYYRREPSGEESARVANVARLTYDMELGDWLNITPFAEFEGVWYSQTRDDDGSDFRAAGTFGATAQTRLTRNYGTFLGFSSVKHIMVPSLTLSYRPEPSMGLEETLRFDALDNAFGRSRIDAKLDNIFYGRDAESDEIWQIARISIYAGTDFWNELPESEDYEIEIDIRPRPEWGLLLAAEHHNTDESLDLDDPLLLQRSIIRLYENIFNRRVDPELRFRYNARFGDYDRVLTYLYYNDPDPDARWNGRIGFSYAETQNRVFNNEILYGLGYRVNDKWSVAFEHRYDLERDNLARQSYELRRIFADCIDTALEFRERESGWDVSLQVSLSAFPGTGIKF